jgi:hypothetical protein
MSGFVEDIDAIPGSSNQPISNDINSATNTMAVNDTMPVATVGSNEFQQDPLYSIPQMPDPIDAWSQLDFDLSFPSFFESIMVPESNWVGAGEVQMPPDLAKVIPDYEEWPGSSDIFGYDFSAAFAQAMEPPQVIEEPVVNRNDITSTSGERAIISTDNARLRHDIFKKSPW